MNANPHEAEWPQKNAKHKRGESGRGPERLSRSNTLIEKHSRAEHLAAADALARLLGIAPIRYQCEGAGAVAAGSATVLQVAHILELTGEFLEIVRVLTDHAGKERKFRSVDLNFFDRDTCKLSRLLDGTEQSFRGVGWVDVGRWGHGFAEVGHKGLGRRIGFRSASRGTEAVQFCAQLLDLVRFGSKSGDLAAQAIEFE